MNSPARASAARFVIFIPEPFPERSVQLLGPEFEVRQGRTGAAWSEDELIGVLGDVDAIAVNSRDPITARVIDGAPRLKVIAKAGSKPTSSVDFAAAARRNIRVLWTPGANAVSVAEMTLAMMLTVAKRLPEAAAHLTAGGWRHYGLLGSELAGKTLGILGLGAIGLEVARRFQAFDGKVIGYGPHISAAAAAARNIELVDLPALYARSDILSLHCELNAQTAGVINAGALAAMKPGAILVNTARGGLVDEDALLAALDAGRLRGAALDVFRTEPVPKGNALIAHPRVFAIPHFAAFTDEASFRETSWALEDTSRVLRGLEPLHLTR
jgi:D-3-phosphoglycerate dehydrogenase